MPRFNAAIAIRYTPHYAKSAGWAPELARVCAALGFKTYYPDPKQFVTAVRDWQQRHPPLSADGMLGPVTWRKLKLVVDALQVSATFVGPHLQWITRINASPERMPSRAVQPAAPVAGPKADEDKVIQEMARVAIQQKYDPYTPVAVSGAYVLDQIRFGAQSNATGQPISQTLHVGEQWQGIAGPRIIVGLIGSGTLGEVIFVTDSGQIYTQTVTGWESDMFAKLWSDVSNNLKPLKTFLEAEAAFLLGMCAATSLAAGALILVGSTTQWLLNNKDNIKKYSHSFQVFLEVRSIIKPISPTLWSNIVDVGVKRFFAEIPETVSKDPIIIARFAGGMLMKLGVAVYTRNFTSLAKWLGMLSEILFAGVRAVPGAFKDTVSAKDLVEKLKAIGAEITEEEAEVIKDEVWRNKAELTRAFEKIAALVF